MNKQTKWRNFALICGALRIAAASSEAAEAPAKDRPNIMVVISDDQSWPHAGAYGNPCVKTPAFDRIAREGVLFSHAFCASPSCTPSRAAILTGQDVWRLREGANLFGTLPQEFEVYPDLLEAVGYAVGYTKKGWSPGSEQAGGRKRNPAGSWYETFEQFIEKVPASAPFCFWYGSFEPHRPYKEGSGKEAGKKLEDVVVPGFLPDVPEIRSDFLDYYHEIDMFDKQLGEVIDLLEKRGQLDNTLILVTSDNGMPFPRAKTNLYDAGTRIPLAIRWGRKIRGGRKVDDFVNLTDVAPTVLEAAGVEIPAGMTGRSLMPLLTSKASGQIDPTRDHVVLGRERHGWNREPNIGYPMRAIRTKDYLYIRNFKPERQPGCDHDPGPSMTYLLENRNREPVQRFFKLFFEPRPEEELYLLAKDPYQMNNVVSDPSMAEIKKELRDLLETHLKQTGDPRMSGQGDAFDRYPYYGPPTGNSKILEMIPALDP